VDDDPARAREPPGQAHHPPRRGTVDVATWRQRDPGGGLLDFNGKHSTSASFRAASQQVAGQQIGEITWAVVVGSDLPRAIGRNRIPWRGAADTADATTR